MYFSNDSSISFRYLFIYEWMWNVSIKNILCTNKMYYKFSIKGL